MKSILFILFVVTGSVCVYGDGSSTPNTNAIDYAKSEFNRRVAGANRQDKSWPTVEQETILKVIDDCSEGSRKILFNTLAGQAETNSDPTSFEDLLTQGFILRLGRSGDWASVQKLSAARCPESIGALTVELRLAIEFKPCVITNLTLAYRAAGTNYSSKVLIKSLERAFPSTRKIGDTDDKFANACDKLIKANCANWEVNFKYPFFLNGESYGDQEGVTNPGLFVTKRSK